MNKKNIVFIFLIYLLALPSFANDNDYTKLIKQNPNSYNAYLNRAQCKYNSNDFSGAIEDCNQAIRINSKNSKAYYIRGLCKSKLIEDDGNQKPIRNIKITSITKPDVDFAPYMKEIENRIKSNWKPPKIYESKHVLLQFKILKDGKLDSVKVLESSNIYAMDLAAQKAVEMSAPFQPLPSSFNEDSIGMKFSFDYNYRGQKYSKFTYNLLMTNVFIIFLHVIMHT